MGEDLAPAGSATSSSYQAAMSASGGPAGAAAPAYVEPTLPPGDGRPGFAHAAAAGGDHGCGDPDCPCWALQVWASTATAAMSGRRPPAHASPPSLQIWQHAPPGLAAAAAAQLGDATGRQGVCAQPAGEPSFAPSAQVSGELQLPVVLGSLASLPASADTCKSCGYLGEDMPEECTMRKCLACPPLDCAVHETPAALTRRPACVALRRVERAPGHTSLWFCLPVVPGR